MDSLKPSKQIHAIARSSRAGELLDANGDTDAETLCAVAAVSAASLSEIGELLSAGRLERWYFVTEQSTYYASERASERVVAVGDSVKNPETTSKSLHASR
jgi:ribosomal protein L15